jgi:hypothetical protein
MSKVIFAGCSFTAGSGWDELGVVEQCKNSPNLWVNLCCDQIDQLKNLELVNLGKGGASNSEIFTIVTRAIAESRFDISMLFCQWTGMPRYNFSVGFELWPTTEQLSPTARSKFDVNLNRGDKWTRKYLDDLLDRLLVLHHLHHEIVKVVEYSNILQKLAKEFNIKLFFINGLCPWDQDYFVRLPGAMPEQFTSFTKKEILNIESRNDEDIFKLYNIMHADYELAGGIDATNWINLYDSFLKNKTDLNFDKMHPGTQSNQHYFHQVKTFLENQQ